MLLEVARAEAEAPRGDIGCGGAIALAHRLEVGVDLLSQRSNVSLRPGFSFHLSAKFSPG